jgi:hypothetical protein
MPVPVVVLVQGEPNLPQIGRTRGTIRSVSCPLDGWQQQAEQGRHYTERNKEFDERKSRAGFGAHLQFLVGDDEHGKL